MPKTTPAAELPAARPAKSSTVHDVAKLAGVSIMTVSRAVNAPGKVSPATLKRVQAAITQSSYVPNLMAHGLRSAKSRLVVALVPTLASQLFSRAIASLTQALDARGYQLMLGQSGYADSREDRLLDAIIGRRPDGIVLTGIMHSPQGRQRLQASGIPVVETWDYTDQPIDMLVGFSHEDVGAQVCRFLVERGRRQMLLLSANDERAMRRNAGFRRAAAQLGIAAPAMQLVPAPSSHASGRAALAAALAEEPEIDAVFCSSDVLAMAVLTEALSRGVQVPQSLAVVGFGDLEFAETLHPALTSVRIDGEALGARVAHCVMSRAEGAVITEKIVDIGFAIIERQSTPQRAR